MPNMHSAVVVCTLDMQRGAVEQPVALPVTEATLPSGGVALIAMVSIVSAALTAVVLHKLHLGLGSGALGSDPYCHLVERGVLQCIAGSSTTAITPTIRHSVELMGT